MNHRAFLIGLVVSLLGHGIATLIVSRMDPPKTDRREMVRFHVSDETEPDRKPPEELDKVDPARRLAMQKEAEKARELADLKAKQAQEATRKALEEARKLLEEKAAKEAEKKPEPPKEPPKPPDPPKEEVKKEPPPAAEMKDKKEPPKKAPPKRGKKKAKKGKKIKERFPEAPTDKPAELVKPEPGQELKKGAAIDTNFVMQGGTGGPGGSGVNVVTGDGMNVYEDRYDDPEAVFADDPEAGNPEGMEDGEPEGPVAGDPNGVTDGDPEVEQSPEGTDVGDGTGNPQSKEERRKAERRRPKPKPKTEALHKISRTPKIKKAKAPDYPEEVRPLNIQGRVFLELVVDENGKVVYVGLKKGLHPELDKVAIDAAWELEFEPALQDGKPIRATIPYKFTFVLR